MDERIKYLMYGLAFGRKLPVREKEPGPGPDIPVESITLIHSGILVGVGKKLRVTAVVFPDNATNKNIIWEISDPLKASIETAGENMINIIGISIGTLTLTCRATDGSGVFDTILIEVVENMPIVFDWFNGYGIRTMPDWVYPGYTVFEVSYLPRTVPGYMWDVEFYPPMSGGSTPYIEGDTIFGNMKKMINTFPLDWPDRYYSRLDDFFPREQQEYNITTNDGSGYGVNGESAEAVGVTDVMSYLCGYSSTHFDDDEFYFDDTVYLGIVEGLSFQIPLRQSKYRDNIVVTKSGDISAVTISDELEISANMLLEEYTKRYVDVTLTIGTILRLTYKIEVTGTNTLEGSHSTIELVDSRSQTLNYGSILDAGNGAKYKIKITGKTAYNQFSNPVKGWVHSISSSDEEIAIVHPDNSVEFTGAGNVTFNVGIKYTYLEYIHPNYIKSEGIEYKTITAGVFSDTIELGRCTSEYVTDGELVYLQLSGVENQAIGEGMVQKIVIDMDTDKVELAGELTRYKSSSIEYSPSPDDARLIHHYKFIKKDNTPQVISFTVNGIESTRKSITI